MASIRFTSRAFIRGGTVRLADAIINSTRPVVRTACHETGKRAQQNILAIIGSTYGQRRGKQRSEPLANRSRYPYRVNTSRRGAQIVFRVDGSFEFKQKFGALNFGTSPHVIAPVNAPWLANPEDDFFSPVPVMWTPTNGSKWGTHFYEEGIQEALDEFPTLL